jgi:Carboxypeptidase regulatory-like domain
MKRKRKPRKKIGTRRALLSTLLSALLLAVFLPVTAIAKKKSAPDTPAIVSGSVFSDNGYALADADVTLAPRKVQSGKSKPMQAVSDARGEFVFHVPAGPAQYTVTVSAKGYRSQQKSVSLQDQERVEVTFQLEHESK